MSQHVDGLIIREASPAEVEDLREKLSEIVFCDIADPNLASFRHTLREGHLPGEHFVSYAALVDGTLAGCFEINFSPQAEDIEGYGAQASHLFRSEHTAVLAGDFVLPAFRGRGIHGRGIDYRLELLARIGIPFALCGILAGNATSLRNYLDRGFASIGEKTINWGLAARPPEATVAVLYGLRVKPV
jgi:GNAT superfamily N-acetyltransferase